MHPNEWNLGEDRNSMCSMKIRLYFCAKLIEESKQYGGLLVFITLIWSNNTGFVVNQYFGVNFASVDDLLVSE